MRMLIVDDDETMCRGIQNRLWKMNFPQLHSIEIALSGEEALSYIQHHRVDILLTDIQMVSMNGLELIEKALKMQPEIYTLILTAHASFQYAQKAISLGTGEFLLKPCSREELHAVMVKLLQKTERDRQDRTINAEHSDDPVLLAKNYVRNNLHKEMNMAILANEMNLSYSYFSKLFKQQTGKNFTTYIMEEKMKEASRLLLAGMKTSNVAAELGYLAPQSFNRAFVNYWKCSPSEYRKQFFHQQEEDKE